MAWYMPSDDGDLRAFRLVSVSAGVCEEWLYRGYLLAVLQPFLGIAGAIAASTVLFAAGHLYQGPGGMVKTGTVGLLMGLLTWATGSIWAPILIHAVLDWMQGDMIARVLRAEEAPSS